MGIFDVFCCICGVSYCYREFDEQSCDGMTTQEIKQLNAKLKWLNKITIMTADNKIYDNCKNLHSDDEFRCGTKKCKTEPIYDYSRYNIFDNDNHGVLIHTDCWKFIKQNYDVKLKYGDLPLINHNITHKKFKTDFYANIYNFKIDTKNITKYQEQEFNYISLLIDGKIDFAESPLKNTINANRIKKVFNQLKIKNNRPSPSISATFYPNNIIKIGNDGNFWKINNDRWNKINEDVIVKKITYDKNNLKSISKMSQIGEPSKIPCFILSFTFNKSNVNVTFITLNSFLGIM